MTPIHGDGNVPPALVLPPGVRVGEGTVIEGDFAFKRFFAKSADALVIGDRSTMDGVRFAIGPSGRMTIGDHCYFTNAVLLCEVEMRIGSFVMIGWNATIADSDFHPLEPALRIEDAIACSPKSAGRARPLIAGQAIVIEDDVWIGPNAVILKGVRLGQGAIIEPGALVTKDVAAHTRVGGNPARVITEP